MTVGSKNKNMTGIFNTRILASVAMLVFVGAVVASSTGAFFSDTETSTGNTFTAGDIDLQIDNESYVTDANGVLVASPSTSWSLKDLIPGVDHFFNFSDVKPGDIGEDTISIHVGSNNAWMCAAARITDDSDQSCTDPENADDPTCANPGLGQGELDSALNFAFWHDDGDNVLETGEETSIFLQGPLSGIGVAGQIRLADSSGSILGGSTPIPGNTTFYIGKAWCFGTLTPAPRAPGALSPLGGTGFTCDGSAVNNAAQTDQVQGDLQFYAVQARNNSTFTCATGYTPTWPQEVRPTLGANLNAYADPNPQTCNVTVDDSGGASFTSIQAAINDAGTTVGEKVCVADGIYNEDVNINKSIILVGSGATSTTVINGQIGGQTGAVMIAADNVTVSGFQINAAANSVAAMRILAVHTGATVSFNKITSASGGGAVDSVGGQTNHTFNNNEFVGVAGSQLVYINGLASNNVASTNVDFTQNSFTGASGIALGQEAGGSSITLNKFSTVTSGYDVEDWGLGNNFNQNNFNDGGLNLQHSENGQTGENGITNAENNWWGDINPADGDVNANVDVDFVPSEVAAFPEN